MTQNPRPAFDSRTIRTIVLAIVGYTFARFAIPSDFMSQEVHGAIADIVVYAGFAIAAWYRKNAKGQITTWWQS